MTRAKKCANSACVHYVEEHRPPQSKYCEAHSATASRDWKQANREKTKLYDQGILVEEARLAKRRDATRQWRMRNPERARLLNRLYVSKHRETKRQQREKAVECASGQKVASITLTLVVFGLNFPVQAASQDILHCPAINLNEAQDSVYKLTEFIGVLISCWLFLRPRLKRVKGDFQKASKFLVRLFKAIKARKKRKHIESADSCNPMLSPASNGAHVHTKMHPVQSKGSGKRARGKEAWREIDAASRLEKRN
jgi:hypothetical protein